MPLARERLASGELRFSAAPGWSGFGRISSRVCARGTLAAARDGIRAASRDAPVTGIYAAMLPMRAAASNARMSVASWSEQLVDDQYIAAGMAGNCLADALPKQALDEPGFARAYNDHVGAVIVRDLDDRFRRMADCRQQLGR